MQTWGHFQKWWFLKILQTQQTETQRLLRGQFLVLRTSSPPGRQPEREARLAIPVQISRCSYSTRCGSGLVCRFAPTSGREGRQGQSRPPPAWLHSPFICISNALAPLPIGCSQDRHATLWRKGPQMPGSPRGAKDRKVHRRVLEWHSLTSYSGAPQGAL